MKLFGRLSVLLCVWLMAVAVLAQSPSPLAPGEGEEQKKKKQELEQKAFLTLDQLIEESRAFRLPENRCWVLTVGADLLWERDEKRARALWAEAIAIFSQLLHQPDDAPGAVPANFRWHLHQLRPQLMQLIANRDPQIALDFLAATRPAAEEQSSGYYNSDQEMHLEATLAQQIAANDPLRGLERAEAMIKAGKPLHLALHILHALRGKDFEAAQKLADLIVARLQAEEPLRPESAFMAVNLLVMAAPPTGNEVQSFVRTTADGSLTRVAALPTEKPKYLISAATARALVERAIASAQAAMANAARQYDQNRRQNALNLLQQLRSMSSYVEKYAPASFSALKRSWAEAEPMMDQGQRNWEVLNKLAEKGSVDLLVEAAAKAPPEMRHSYFQRAAQMASSQGDVERARQIIKENLADSGQRRQALNEIESHLLSQKINEKKFEEARESIARQGSDLDRVNWLLQLSAAAQNAEKKELALQLLDEAWGFVDGEPQTSPQFFAQLQIASAYLHLRPERSFEIIEGTIDKYNELFAATAVLGSFELQGNFREKEMILYAGNSSSAYLPQYAQQLAALSAVDLARVQAAINRCARVELRTSLQLAVLQQLLRRPESGARHFGGIGFGGVRRRHFH